MGPPTDQSRALGPKSCSSLSIKSDDSNFEFCCCEDGSEDPPASPTLPFSSPTWENPASSYILSPARSSESHGVHIIAGSQRQRRIDVPFQESSASMKFCHVHDEAPKGSPVPVADGDGMTDTSDRHSEDAIGVAQVEKKSLRSLMLQRRELDHLPPLANVRSATVPQRSARISKSSKRSSPSSLPATPTPSSPALQLRSDINFDTPRRSSRWSFGLDFLQSKRASSPNNGLEIRDSERMKMIHCHDPQVIRESSYETPELSRQSTSSSSSAGEPESKDMISSDYQGVGQSTKVKYFRNELSSPPASPARAATPHQPRPVPESAGYGQSPRPSTPRANAPMSPHAQHYQHQRARTEQLRRKTLPLSRNYYLGSCFFPSPVTSH